MKPVSCHRVSITHITRWKKQGFYHPVTYISGIHRSHDGKNEGFCHPVRYMSGIYGSRDGLKRVNSIA